MIHKSNFLYLLSLSILLLSACSDVKKTENKQPNILLIVADDLGFTDLGAYGGEIKTPTLDALSKEGIQFTNFHVLPTCSPTRSALMSGRDNHVAGVGVMQESRYPGLQNVPGYEGVLSSELFTMPELFRSEGYHTYMSGKWHLGEDVDQIPSAHGFEHTFTLVEGAASHWADKRRLSSTTTVTYRSNGEVVENLPADFYSTKNFTDSLIHFVDMNKADDKPFLAYLAYPAPHDPLHAPADYIAKYKGTYDMGWDNLRQERLENLKNLGIVPQDFPQEFTFNPMLKSWDKLSDEDKAKFARDMEVYAAMVDYMDMSLNRLFTYLKDNDMWDNTIVVFISDNGANGAPATAYPGNRNGKHLSTFDNSLENRGMPGSFVEMGAGWAQASSAPFRMFKSFASEGGIKSPLIIKGINKLSSTELNKSLLHVTDLFPTFIDMCNLEYPTTIDNKQLEALPGESFKTILTGETFDFNRKQGLGYELFEMKAYIDGDWKILRQVNPFGNSQWQLYNLKQDPGETENLSEIYPEKKAELIALYEAYVKANGVHDHKGIYDKGFQRAYKVSE